MEVNIFEGARRISKAILILILVLGAVLLYESGSEGAQGTLLTLLLTFVGFWLFCRILGWVVRGFMGIPSGSDKRPSKDRLQ